MTAPFAARAVEHYSWNLEISYYLSAVLIASVVTSVVSTISAIIASVVSVIPVASLFVAAMVSAMVAVASVVASIAYPNFPLVVLVVSRDPCADFVSTAIAGVAVVSGHPAFFASPFPMAGIALVSMAAPVAV